MIKCRGECGETKPENNKQPSEMSWEEVDLQGWHYGPWWYCFYCSSVFFDRLSRATKHVGGIVSDE